MKTTRTTNKKERKIIEKDSNKRQDTEQHFPPPKADPDFQQGYRECISMYALHAPNKRGVRRILEEHCIILENDCIKRPSRTTYAAYEGYRQALKDILKQQTKRT